MTALPILWCTGRLHYVQPAPPDFPESLNTCPIVEALGGNTQGLMLPFTYLRWLLLTTHPDSDSCTPGGRRRLCRTAVPGARDRSIRPTPSDTTWRGHLPCWCCCLPGGASRTGVNDLLKHRYGCATASDIGQLPSRPIVINHHYFVWLSDVFHVLQGTVYAGAWHPAVVGGRQGTVSPLPE